MKSVLLMTAAAAAALSLAACQKPREQAANTPAPGTSNEAVNAAQDAASAAVGQMSAATVGASTTDGFVTALATSDMYEIEAGKVAEKRAQSPAVKAFGRMMVTDHTAMSNEVKPLIAAAGASAPAALDERRKGMIDNLNAAKPGDFDKTYLSQQETAHEEALVLVKGYAEDGGDAGLKAAAVKAIPKVQAHLDKVHELEATPPAPPAKK